MWPEGRLKSQHPFQTVRADFRHTATSGLSARRITQPSCRQEVCPDSGSSRAGDAIQSLRSTRDPSAVPGPPSGCAPRASDPQALESPVHVAVHIDEVVRRVARTEVLTSAAQHRVDLGDHASNILVTTLSGCQLPDPLPYPIHRLGTRPVLQVVPPRALLLPQPPSHALAHMVTKVRQSNRAGSFDLPLVALPGGYSGKR